MPGRQANCFGCNREMISFRRSVNFWLNVLKGLIGIGLDIDDRQVVEFTLFEAGAC
jgi:hypothetical protein